MSQIFHLYLDDSGSRHPDHSKGGGTQWFALGGVLLRESDEHTIRALVDAFRQRWAKQLGDTPLHSADIRRKQGAFAWLGTTADGAQAFVPALDALIADCPMHCTACVIDRKGYARVYEPQYDRSKRWMLCKTAFTIVVERSAKLVARENGRLRVYVERSGREIDKTIRGYYDELREQGMPFTDNMRQYSPLESTSFRELLCGFETKNKTSPLMQLADLCLYPICRGGYSDGRQDYQSLVRNKKLVDSLLPPDDLKRLGIKYSRFEHVPRESA